MSSRNVSAGKYSNGSNVGNTGDVGKHSNAGNVGNHW